MNKDLFLKNTIKQSRKNRGVTQKELAKALGVSRQTIIILEKNNYTPSLLLAFKLSGYFHEPIENLFHLEHDNQL